MPKVTQRDKNVFLDEIVKDAKADKELRKKFRNPYDIISMEDYFKIMKAKAKHMNVDLSGEGNGDKFNMEKDLMDMQRHILDMENSNLERRKAAYGFIGKEVVVKKRDSETGKHTTFTGIVDYVSFPKDAKESILYVNGQPVKMNDIIGSGNIEDAVMHSKGASYEESFKTTKMAFEDVNQAMEALDNECKLLEVAQSKEEVGVLFERAKENLETIKKMEKESNEEIKKLEKDVKNTTKELVNFTEESDEDDDDPAWKIDMSKAQLDKKKPLWKKKMTKEDLELKLVNMQNALIDARKKNDEFKTIIPEAKKKMIVMSDRTILKDREVGCTTSK